MKEFKEDKIELEKKIAELLTKFNDKYDVSITEIELNTFLNYLNGKEKYNVSVKVDL